MMSSIQSISGRVLLEYLDTEARAGRLNAGTASSRRSAVREVLQIAFGDAWTDTSFAIGDVELLLARFAEARQGDFTPETIRSYRSNFRRTVELSSDCSESVLADADWFTYQFPLREGVAVEMRLPVDLTPTEARRLATLITALPVEPS